MSCRRVFLTIQKKNCQNYFKILNSSENVTNGILDRSSHIALLCHIWLSKESSKKHLQVGLGWGGAGELNPILVTLVHLCSIYCLDLFHYFKLKCLISCSFLFGLKSAVKTSFSIINKLILKVWTRLCLFKTTSDIFFVNFYIHLLHPCCTNKCVLHKKLK